MRLPTVAGLVTAAVLVACAVVLWPAGGWTASAVDGPARLHLQAVERTPWPLPTGFRICADSGRC
jgi:hypothetical protein